MLGETSYRRSLLGVVTWRGTAFREVILSGDFRSTKPMRDFLVCQGVPSDSILIEGHSTSTRENALFTAEFIRKIPGPYVLLTSDYHMFRAHRAFTKAGVAVTPAPFSDVLKTFNDPLRRWTGFLVLAVRKQSRLPIIGFEAGSKIRQLKDRKRATGCIQDRPSYFPSQNR